MPAQSGLEILAVSLPWPMANAVYMGGSLLAQRQLLVCRPQGKQTGVMAYTAQQKNKREGLKKSFFGKLKTCSKM